MYPSGEDAVASVDVVLETPASMATTDLEEQTLLSSKLSKERHWSKLKTQVTVTKRLHHLNTTEGRLQQRERQLFKSSAVTPGLKGHAIQKFSNLWGKSLVSSAASSASPTQKPGAGNVC